MSFKILVSNIDFFFKKKRLERGLLTISHFYDFTFRVEIKTLEYYSEKDI